MKTITRKSLLYKTGVEYGDYAINHVEGCSHGCKYPCYAYLQKKRFGAVKDYDDWCSPKLVSNALELLEKELTPKRIAEIKNVHLCFTTDPFPYHNLPDNYDLYNTCASIHNMSIKIIRLLNSKSIPVTVLTKGLLPTARYPVDILGEKHFCFGSVFGGVYDVAIIKSEDLHPDNYYGISLVSLDEHFRNEWEPNTAKYVDRIGQLRHLHDNGYKTWVSMEPYPTTSSYNQRHGWYQDDIDHFYDGDRDFWAAHAFRKILDNIDFVDRIVFGQWNYGGVILSADLTSYLDLINHTLIPFCREHNIECIIKKRGKGYCDGLPRETDERL